MRLCRSKRRPVRTAFLLGLVAAALSRCASSPPAFQPPAATSSQTQGPEILAQAKQLASFLKEKLLLDAAQEEKTTESAVRLLERNTRILAPEGVKRRTRLEALRASGAAFDRDMMSILTAGQLLKYADLKRQFQGALTGQSVPPRRGAV